MTTKAERQAITASMPKCECGNVRSRENTHCGRCLQQIAEFDLESRRQEALDWLMNDPESPFVKSRG